MISKNIEDIDVKVNKLSIKILVCDEFNFEYINALESVCNLSVSFGKCFSEQRWANCFYINILQNLPSVLLIPYLYPWLPNIRLFLWIMSK